MRVFFKKWISFFENSSCLENGFVSRKFGVCFFENGSLFFENSMFFWKIAVFFENSGFVFSKMGLFF